MIRDLKNYHTPIFAEFTISIRMIDDCGPYLVASTYATKKDYEVLVPMILGLSGDPGSFYMSHEVPGGELAVHGHYTHSDRLYFELYLPLNDASIITEANRSRSLGDMIEALQDAVYIFMRDIIGLPDDILCGEA